MTYQPSGPSEPHRPPPSTGRRRRIEGLPAQLFRMGLGPLFRGRALLLVHTGRVPGPARRTVVEVVETAVIDGRRCWTVASGAGPDADWYRNLVRTPQATVQAGRRFHVVTARSVPPEESAELIARYAPQRSALARRLCAYMGFGHLGSGADRSVGGCRPAGDPVSFVRLIAGSPRAESAPASPSR
ncbi:nitroreductase family deazaflavin-dependent oxidoreductase [Streptomyces sp. NPDC057557]|uniref:nitroreductase family deazaflavin-dependent oxidoreductase n=1 Tax=Streptomyces sp. NPDC057557 TaxID=3346167 RepID=UPI0036783082